MRRGLIQPHGVFNPRISAYSSRFQSWNEGVKSVLATIRELDEDGAVFILIRKGDLESEEKHYTHLGGPAVRLGGGGSADAQV